MGEVRSFKNKNVKLKFIEGRATNTRLMGVMGVIAVFVDGSGNKLTHIYHLDFEDFGIDGYDQYKNLSDDEINIRLMRVIGGLGGYLVPINFEELIFLLKSAHKIRENFDGIELLNEYDYFFNNDIRLDENHIFKLMNRISEKIVMPEQIINYFFMRLVGGDKEGIKFLSQREIEIENF